MTDNEAASQPAPVGQVERHVRCWRATRTAECYVDHDGRILGEVAEVIGGAYYADAPLGTLLGRYIDRNSAQRAVERACVDLPARAAADAATKRLP